MSDKIKTLSQAIRLGATFRPQCFAGFYDEASGIGRTCAFGAAFEACGAEVQLGSLAWPQFIRILRERGWLENVRQKTICPQCASADHAHSNPEKCGTLYAVVVALNNEHGWSREQIADWLESQGL